MKKDLNKIIELAKNFDLVGFWESNTVAAQNKVENEKDVEIIPIKVMEVETDSKAGKIWGVIANENIIQIKTGAITHEKLEAIKEQVTKEFENMKSNILAKTRYLKNHETVMLKAIQETATTLNDEDFEFIMLLPNYSQYPRKTIKWIASVMLIQWCCENTPEKNEVPAGIGRLPTPLNWAKNKEDLYYLIRELYNRGFIYGDRSDTAEWLRMMFDNSGQVSTILREIQPGRSLEKRPKNAITLDEILKGDEKI